MVAINLNFNNFNGVGAFLNLFSGFGNEFEITSEGVLCKIIALECPDCGTNMDHNGHNDHTKKNLGTFKVGTSCGVKIPIIGTFFYKNVFMQVKPA